MPGRTLSAPQITAFGRAYLAAVIVSGLIAVAFCLIDVQSHPLPYQWYLLAALTLVSGSATVNLPTVGASISVSETFVFASVLLFGPSAGTITVALDGLVISFWMAKRRPEWYRALFNMAAPGLSIWVAANLLFAISGIKPLFLQQSPINALFVPLLVFAVVYFGLNSWLIAFAVAFEARISPYQVWRENFLWLSLNYFSGASVALLLVGYSNSVDLRFVGVIVPLLLVLYLTFKTTMGRVEDANSHIQQVNRLYLSTIETLAMAIDAKDQITHGHIRRVQQYAVGLARELGVSDERLLKAIEAAALLHDMGKLAVPEYILNKPGKLTPAEFEKMKLHASVGADILAAIEFPYPVVPIVRHHHENWDGSGYPDGLRGTDIPIGARILSVVDCFDALISDRPYRPRLSDDDALAILVQRRGSMYVPWVVDTFLRVHRPIAPNHADQSLIDGPLSSALPSPPTSSEAHLDEISASAGEMLTLYELARALAGQPNMADAADAIAKQVRRLIPSSLAVFFLYQPARDELIAEHAIGDGASIVKGLHIGLGQRLSGWVAANRHTIANSDPQLDLGEIARSASIKLQACLSAPILAGDELVGVLSLYSPRPNAFDEDHRRIIEAIGRQIGQTFKKSHENGASEEHLKRLPKLDQLEQLVEMRSGNRELNESNLTLLFIGVVDFHEIMRVHGRQVANEILHHVMDQASRSLRVVDVLCRFGADQLVAILHEADREIGKLAAIRLHENIERNPFMRGAVPPIRIAVSSVSTPDDGQSLRELIDRGKSRMMTDELRQRSSAVH